MKIRVDPEAIEFARARGGLIYIWASESGLLHVSAKPPRDSAEWERVPVDEIEVRLDPGLAATESWHVSLRRFPRKTLVATSDFTRTPVQDVWGSGL